MENEKILNTYLYAMVLQIHLGVIRPDEIRDYFAKLGDFPLQQFDKAVEAMQKAGVSRESVKGMDDVAVH